MFDRGIISTLIVGLLGTLALILILIFALAVMNQPTVPELREAIIPIITGVIGIGVQGRTSGDPPQPVTVTNDTTDPVLVEEV